MAEFFIDEQQVEFLLRGIAIPPQPDILISINALKRSSQPDLNRLISLISQDVGLSGAVLKTINSPLFGLRRKIMSIRQAALLMGQESLINIVTGLALKNALPRQACAELLPFWDTAMEVGLVCVLLERELRNRSADELYMLGLFHNTGMVLLRQKFTDYFSVLAQAYRQSEQRITDIENQYFQTNHAVVGYYVAKSWNLPQQISMAIHQHHNVALALAESDLDDSVKFLLAILKLAEHLVGLSRVFGQVQTDYEWQSVADAVLNYLNLDDEQFKNLKSLVLERLYEQGAQSQSG